jgi:hypothetical protein
MAEQTEQIELPPPKDMSFTQKDLKAYDGSQESYPIYVSLKGMSRLVVY